MLPRLGLIPSKPLVEELCRSLMFSNQASVWLKKGMHEKVSTLISNGNAHFCEGFQFLKSMGGQYVHISCHSNPSPISLSVATLRGMYPDMLHTPSLALSPGVDQECIS